MDNANLGLALLGLAAVGGIFLTIWAVFAIGAACIRAFRKAVWTRALYIARERPDTLADVIPQLVEMGVILNPVALEAHMPRSVRKFLDAAPAPEPTEVEIVMTGAVPVTTMEVAVEMTTTDENNMYFSAASDAWARVRELEDQIILLEAERDYKDELRARHLRRVRRIEEALEDPTANLFAAVHPFLARDHEPLVAVPA